MTRRVAVWAMAAMVAACSSGGGSTDPGPTPAIAISLSPTAASVAQGGSTAVTATLTRSGGFTGAVDLAVSGAPAGVTGSVGTPQTNGGSTTATITVSVGAAVAAGAYQLTVTGTGSGVSAVSATFDLTVTSAAGFSLSASAVSVTAGSTAPSTVTITRTGGFTGAVALSATTIPAGLTASFNPASATGNSSTLTIGAGAAVAAGSYTVAIKGSAAGLADQSANVAVTVTAPAAGNAQISLACFAPVWVAYQDGGGAWTRATTVSANTYRISANSAVVAVAWVYGAPNYQIQVNYFPKAFLTATPTVDFCGVSPPLGTKSVSGTAAGLSGNDRANVSMGGGFGLATVARPAFGLNTVLNGPQDLIAWRHDPVAEAGGTNRDRGLIRRDQDIPHLGSVGTIDLAGSESFAPATGVMTVAGVAAGEKLTHGMQYLTRAACTNAPLYQVTADMPSPFTAYGVPASAQRADDYHMMTTVAIGGEGTPLVGHTSSRSVVEVFHTIASHSITLPAGITDAAVTTLAGPYKRLQAAFTNNNFNSVGGLIYNSTSPIRVVAIIFAGVNLPNGPVTIAMPDFSGVAGFDATWAPATTATGIWTVQAVGTTQGTGPLCQEGLRSYAADRLGTF